MDRRRLVYALTTGLTVLLLSAWWVGPFLFGHEYMTDMKYGFRPEGAADSFWDMFFPLAAPLDFIITGSRSSGSSPWSFAGTSPAPRSV